VGLLEPTSKESLRQLSMIAARFLGRIRVVTKLPKAAIERISTELSASEQDRIAKRLIRLIDEDVTAWDAAFAKSPKKLRRFADKALEEHRLGRTELLDVEKL
jgi:hypothetical protein